MFFLQLNCSDESRLLQLKFREAPTERDKSLHMLRSWRGSQTPQGMSESMRVCWCEEERKGLQDVQDHCSDEN